MRGRGFGWLLLAALAGVAGRAGSAQAQVTLPEVVVAAPSPIQ